MQGGVRGGADELALPIAFVCVTFSCWPPAHALSIVNDWAPLRFGRCSCSYIDRLCRSGQVNAASPDNGGGCCAIVAVVD